MSKKSNFRIGLNIHGEFKIKEFDKSLKREILSRDLTREEKEFVMLLFNVSQHDKQLRKDFPEDYVE